MAGGYIYVLVNSSLPGLIKVGRTTRLTFDRAAELSSATGVPTPFIVAFEQYFSDCDVAETFVHAELERRELRPAKNREFFQATPNEVIRIILQAPGLCEPDDPALPPENNDDDADLFTEADFESDLEIEGSMPSRPWDGILEEADKHYYGFDDYLQDEREAAKLYQQAARLGSLLAYEMLGRIFIDADDPKTAWPKALQYLKEGAKRGNYYCYSEMARLFGYNEQNDNEVKCWKHFFSQRKKDIISESKITIKNSCLHQRDI